MRNINRSVVAGTLTLPLLLGGAGLAAADTTVDQDARYNSDDGISAEVNADNGHEDEGILEGLLDFGDEQDDEQDNEQGEDDAVLGGLFE
jgi:hypothetical protein